jgi:hypothetical protein
MHLARAIAHYQDRISAYIRDEEVAWPWDLRLAAQEQPTPSENPLQPSV